jgi:hypothetical protein
MEEIFRSTFQLVASVRVPGIEFEEARADRFAIRTDRNAQVTMQRCLKGA